MSKYEVMIDVAGTVHIDIEANSHTEAYKKAAKWFDKRKTIETGWLYEQNFYVEDEHGLQLEYEGG